jgi:hypothetical protein
VKCGCNDFNTRRYYRLRTWKAFEQGDGSGTTGISEDLAELWEEHAEQSLDLVFVACDFIGELCMQADQFARLSQSLPSVHSRCALPR